MKKFIEKKLTEENTKEDNFWIDDYLDEDAVELEEWAFMQGYYQNN